MKTFHRRMAESICRRVAGQYSARRFLEVASAMSDRRPGRRRHEAWIDIAEAAIAGDHVRRAFFGSAKFAIPHHVAGTEILHRAPWRIAEAAGVARRHAKADRCGKSGRRQGRSEDDRHDAEFKPPRYRRKARPPTAVLPKRVPLKFKRRHAYLVNHLNRPAAEAHKGHEAAKPIDWGRPRWQYRIG
jgi:hypothetical protein